VANPHFSTNVHSLVRTTAPDPLLTLAEAKAHCRVDGSDDDAYIADLVATAEMMLDGPRGEVGKCLATQRWTLKTGRFMAKDRLWLPVFPLISVISGAYFDAENTSQTLVLNDFTVFGNEDWAYIEPLTAWPAMYDRPDALTLVLSCGYGDPIDVPANIRHAAKMLVGYLYDNRAPLDGNMPAIPDAVSHMIGLTKVGWVGA
jgi:uncharacterized phiE125 gp8 family phage protein